MTSIDEINADIVGYIGEIYPDIPFVSQETLEGIPRPAFKFIIDEIKSERYTAGAVKRTYPAELVYYAKNTNSPKLESLEVYEAIEPTLFELCDKVDVSINTAEAIFTATFELCEIGDFGDGGIGFDEGSGEDMETLNLTKYLEE